MTRIGFIKCYADYYRDDLTVEVIFFGQGTQGGNVVPNLEATAPADTMKPKL